MKKYLILIAMSGFIICLDQATKMYIHSQFNHGDTVSVIHNFFNITYVRNTGAAFGFLRDANETLRNLFFLSVPPLAAIVIFFMLRATPKEDVWAVFSLSAIFAGAIGNYIDRLHYGFVVDFLDFHYYGQVSWPAFNVADISIVTGIGLMVLLEMRKKKPVPANV
ncbi:MAG: signal peptidase II [Bdellovibrionaceae bacterium]|nr:signal peptidase II [Pseudobdellovibrionaceae bacterium]